MEWPKYGEVIGSILAVGGLAVISYVVVAVGNDQALGALIALLAAATGYYLRGRVEAGAENPPVRH